MENIKRRFIGNKSFYRKALLIAVPIMLQNGITNFVGMLDNIMVGQIGTAQMSGVAIVNQLLIIYYLCIFGGVSGTGIFTAQYYGEGNDDGIRHTFRFKLWMGIVLSVIVAAVFLTFGGRLIQMYLNGGSSDAAVAFTSGMSYMKIMLFGVPAFMILNVYSGTLRDCAETVVPMKAGITAVCVNLVLNYLLIYGKFGCPELGVRGAAIATVVSRYVEASIVIIWTHRHKEKNTYIEGMYETLSVPLPLAKRYFVKGLPLLLNETMWSMGIAMLTQCYSVRGLNVIAGLNIANTINNLFNVVFISMGDAVAIIVGQLLGAGKMEEARDTDNKLIAFSVVSCLVIALAMAALAPFFPKIYNTAPQARTLAMQFIIAQAVFMPQNAFVHAAYFTLRAGGRAVVTFLFDSVFIWCVSVPVAFILSRYTGIYAVAIFSVVQAVDLIKCGIGFALVKKGVWLRNIVSG